MKLKLSHLWRWDGELSRQPFVIWAALLFAVKYNLDRLLLGAVFGRNWSVFSYFGQPFPWIDGVSPAKSPVEFAALLAAGLPFLWMGIVLCLKRLRAARIPLWSVVLFVIPILKWFLFVALAIVPSRDPANESTSPHPPKWMPKSKLGSGLLAVGISTLLAILATALSTTVLREYSWGLFAGVPFCMGFLAAVIHGAAEPRRLSQSLSMALITVAMTGAALLAVALEGFICILMAAPLALILAVAGALIGHVVQASRWQRKQPHFFCVPLLAL